MVLDGWLSLATCVAWSAWGMLSCTPFFPGVLNCVVLGAYFWVRVVPAGVFREGAAPHRTRLRHRVGACVPWFTCGSPRGFLGFISLCVSVCVTVVRS